MAPFDLLIHLFKLLLNFHFAFVPSVRDLLNCKLDSSNFQNISFLNFIIYFLIVVFQGSDDQVHIFTHTLSFDRVIRVLLGVLLVSISKAGGIFKVKCAVPEIQDLQ